MFKLSMIIASVLVMLGCSSENEPVIAEPVSILAIGQSNMKNGYNDYVFFDYLEEALGYTITVDNKAVDGSPVIDWADIYIKDIDKKYDMILWHQGESDTVSNTGFGDYFNALNSVIEQLRISNPDTPIYVAVATYAYGRSNLSVYDAQQQVVVWNDNVFTGPFTDIYGAEFRYDNVHFTDEALRLIAQDWADAIGKIK